MYFYCVIEEDSTKTKHWKEVVVFLPYCDWVVSKIRVIGNCMNGACDGIKVHKYIVSKRKE